MLINIFCKKYNFSKEEAQLLFNQMERLEFKKKRKIIAEGNYNSNLYLIEKGILQVHSLMKGVETTHWFESDGNVFFSVSSYIGNKPSLLTFEALTDVSVFCITREKLNELFCSSISWSNMGRRFIEQNWLQLEKELFDWDKPTAKERYLSLLNTTPELFKHVPLQLIASYLRITPQSLSRIRAGF